MCAGEPSRAGPGRAELVSGRRPPPRGRDFSVTASATAVAPQGRLMPQRLITLAPVTQSAGRTTAGSVGSGTGATSRGAATNTCCESQFPRRVVHDCWTLPKCECCSHVSFARILESLIVCSLFRTMTRGVERGGEAYVISAVAGFPSLFLSCRCAASSIKKLLTTVNCSFVSNPLARKRRRRGRRFSSVGEKALPHFSCCSTSPPQPLPLHWICLQRRRRRSRRVQTPFHC